MVYHYTQKIGLTLIELVVCTTIIGILASIAVPISKNVIRYQKESQLKENLQLLREAIDKYYEKYRLQHPDADEDECWPKNLEDLVRAKILRRIPIDPITGKAEWRTISSKDSLTASFSDNYNVFDVRSTATGTTLNGVPYNEL